MTLRLWGCSDTGRVRTRNEDMIVLGTTPFRNRRDATRIDTGPGTPARLVAVADGVGGSPAGDQASRIVLEEAVERTRMLPPGMPARHAVMEIEKQFRDVNRELVSRGMLGNRRRGMSTTLSGIVWYEGMAFMVHAGDSRVYSWKDDALIQISRDHTLREQMGDPSIPGNIIVNCFGMETEFYLDLRVIRWASPDDMPVLMLCSDGLSDTLDNSCIKTIFRQRRETCGSREETGLEATGETLLREALDQGAKDNVSIVLIEAEISA
jgi:PPM family protein phosphatase